MELEQMNPVELSKPMSRRDTARQSLSEVTVADTAHQTANDSTKSPVVVETDEVAFVMKVLNVTPDLTSPRGSPAPDLTSPRTEWLTLEFCSPPESPRPKTPGSESPDEECSWNEYLKVVSTSNRTEDDEESRVIELDHKARMIEFVARHELTKLELGLHRYQLFHNKFARYVDLIRSHGDTLILFIDRVLEFDSRWKRVTRTLIITESALYDCEERFWGTSVKLCDRFPLKSIDAVFCSTFDDNSVVIHVDDGSSAMFDMPLKAEFLKTLNYKTGLEPLFASEVTVTRKDGTKKLVTYSASAPTRPVFLHKFNTGTYSFY